MRESPLIVEILVLFCGISFAPLQGKSGEVPPGVRGQNEERVRGGLHKVCGNAEKATDKPVDPGHDSRDKNTSYSIKSVPVPA